MLQNNHNSIKQILTFINVINSSFLPALSQSGCLLYFKLLLYYLNLNQTPNKKSLKSTKNGKDDR